MVFQELGTKTIQKQKGTGKEVQPQSWEDQSRGGTKGDEVEFKVAAKGQNMTGLTNKK